MAMTIGDVKRFNLPDDTEIIIDVASLKMTNNREATHMGIARKYNGFDRWFFDGELDEKNMCGYETAKLMIRC